MRVGRELEAMLVLAQSSGASGKSLAEFSLPRKVTKLPREDLRRVGTEKGVKNLLKNTQGNEGVNEGAFIQWILCK